ncbi:hypothetical protein CPC08DRAFT_708151 [Agrocybe pediades]|nr:hypothetical protein CPC08DRAFT_708151 [Agrocybe pediades]
MNRDSSGPNNDSICIEISPPLLHHNRCPAQLLPNELLLIIFSFLELKPFTVAHSVCKRWKQLLPLTDMHPIRQRMLRLVSHMLSHPRFLDTRPWTLKTIKPFDRKAYINALLSQYPAVPEEFRLWIMEWPARMVPFGMWPGSPFTFHNAVTFEEADGTNWLAYLPEGSPSLFTLLHSHPSHDDHCIPALLFWKDDLRAYWLIFDQGEPELFGRVFVSDSDMENSPVVCRIPYEDDDIMDELPVITCNDWLHFIEICWDHQIKLALSRERPARFSPFIKDEPVSYPVSYHLGAWIATIRPTHPWISSTNPKVLEELRRHVYPG